MRKTLVCLILAAVSVAFPGCTRQAATGTAGQPRAADGEITVRLLTGATGIDDKSYNAAAWRGILEFYGDTWASQTKRGIAYDVITAQTQDTYLPTLTQATDEGYDLIVATGSAWAPLLAQVAASNPRQKYMLVDVGGINLPNVMQAVYAEHEGSYLVGAAVAMKAQEDGIASPRFGFIGGIPGPTITKFEVGFAQGVLSVIPGAQIVDYYVNSWGEPAIAKTQAKNWYDSGVYAIYSAAGYSGNGTIAQAKEYRAAGRNVWAIGVDSDQHEEGLYNSSESAVLTSMLKRVESSLIYGLEAVRDNSFEGSVITFDLKMDGVGYSTINPQLSNSIIIQLEVFKRDIINGLIKVAASYAQARQLPSFPQDLKASDEE